MTTRAGKIFALGMIACFFYSFYGLEYANSDISDALFFYENAENTIGIAVKNLSGLHNADVDVSQLVSDLNEASNKISESQLAIINQEYDESKQFSEEAQEIALKVITDAALIRGQRISFLQDLDREMAKAILETMFVSLVFYFVYRHLEKKYIENMLNSTIEVKKNES